MYLFNHGVLKRIDEGAALFLSAAPLPRCCVVRKQRKTFYLFLISFILAKVLTGST